MYIHGSDIHTLCHSYGDVGICQHVFTEGYKSLAGCRETHVFARQDELAVTQVLLGDCMEHKGLLVKSQTRLG